MQANGVAAGVMVTNVEEAKFYADKGVKYITFSSDKRMMNQIFQKSKDDLDKALNG